MKPLFLTLLFWSIGYTVEGFSDLGQALGLLLLLTVSLLVTRYCIQMDHLGEVHFG